MSGDPLADVDPSDVVSTAYAAQHVDVPAPRFSQWARRRGLAPLGHVRLGRSFVAVWSMDAVLDAERRGPVARTSSN